MLKACQQYIAASQKAGAKEKGFEWPPHKHVQQGVATEEEATTMQLE